MKTAIDLAGAIEFAEGYGANIVRCDRYIID